MKKLAKEICMGDKIYAIGTQNKPEFKGLAIKVATVSVTKVKKMTLSTVEGNDLQTIYTDDNKSVTVLPTQRINTESKDSTSIFTDAATVKGIVSAINRKASDDLEQFEALINKTKNEMNGQAAVIDLALREEASAE